MADKTHLVTSPALTRTDVIAGTLLLVREGYSYDRARSDSITWSTSIIF